MSLADDIRDGIEIAKDTVPIVLSLSVAIAKVIEAKDDPTAQLRALQDAAEALKLRMDQLKFPEESKEG